MNLWKRFSSSLSFPDWLYSPPSLLSFGYLKLLTPEVKWPGREADFSLLSSAKVKNAVAIPLPLTCLGARVAYSLQ